MGGTHPLVIAVYNTKDNHERDGRKVVIENPFRCRHAFRLQHITAAS